MFTAAALFVIAHTIPMVDGLVEIRSAETFPTQRICELRVYILNRYDPSNFYYKCEVKK